MQELVTGSTTENFAYDSYLRTSEFRRNGATVELYLHDDLSDNIAAVSNGTSGIGALRKRIVWDGTDTPLWMFDADRGVTVYFEQDTGGNVRRLHAGERITGGGAFTGDLGGYAYTAFGRPIAVAEPGGVAIPKIDGGDYFQRIQWQGRWLYNRSGGLYNFRARFWSPQLGAFLQLDQYQFLSSGGTLWSWPGHNPFRWRDPSGRVGFDGASTDRAIGSPRDWSDPTFRQGLGAGGLAGAAASVGALFASIEAGAWGLVSSLLRSPVAALRVAGAAAGGAALSVKNCSGDGTISSAESAAARASLTGALRARALQQAGFGTNGNPIILDESLSARGVADALRAQGFNVRSVEEIFGNGTKDPVIREFAESVGARVLTADRGHQPGEGFGQAAIQADGRVGADVPSLARILGDAMK